MSTEALSASLLPSLALVGMLGFRHGFDADHIAVIDGIDLSETGPSGGGLMVTKTDDGPDLIRAEITAGRLTFAAVLALPDGAA